MMVEQNDGIERTPHPPSEILSAYMDGELDARSQADVRAHIDGCAECMGRLSLLGAARESIRTLPPEGMDEMSARRLDKALIMDVPVRPESRSRFLGVPVSTLAGVAAMLVLAVFIGVAANLFGPGSPSGTASLKDSAKESKGSFGSRASTPEMSPADSGAESGADSDGGSPSAASEAPAGEAPAEGGGGDPAEGPAEPASPRGPLFTSRPVDAAAKELPVDAEHLPLARSVPTGKDAADLNAGIASIAEGDPILLAAVAAVKQKDPASVFTYVEHVEVGGEPAWLVVYTEKGACCAFKIQTKPGAP